MNSIRTIKPGYAAAFLLLAGLGALACGPFFPNTLLDRADQAALTAPDAWFHLELERMKLATSVHRALPATNHATQTLDAEAIDLRAALLNAGASPATVESIISRHLAEREKIILFAKVEDDAEDNLNPFAPKPKWILRPSPTNAVRIQGPMPQVVPGLPAEFADYFRGSVAWHRGKMAEARAAWTALLKRPESQRRFRSTWAAFMLGKSWEEEDRDLAIQCFQQTRDLARGGFVDTLGLAASSLGWEARMHLRNRKFAQAIDLYLEQAATGDPTAIPSLRYTANHAILGSGPSGARTLAAHPRAQKVITAFVISSQWTLTPMDVDPPWKETMLNALDAASRKATIFPAPPPTWHKYQSTASRWLEAVEAAGVKDVASSERLALAAYQCGEMDNTERWLKRAPSTPLAQWLRAKLLLRDGKIDAAAEILAQLVRRFPIHDTDLVPAVPGLPGSLYVEIGVDLANVSAVQHWHAELGLIRLARRQYAEALDALARSSFWMDAAYVAERVLTLDELKKYVDRNWPAPPPVNAQGDAAAEGSDSVARAYHYGLLTVGQQLRHLLARRLARAERGEEARAYYPPAYVPLFDQLHAALGVARRSRVPPAERAEAFFAAACITRSNGLELVGSEVEPDWRIHRGRHAQGVSASSRAMLQGTNLLGPTPDEIQRTAQHSVHPEQRWHYRYTAAHLAWAAAQLMPDNSEATARVLCIGGSWIKYLNPQEADAFYKTLVRRCRKTAIGAEADRIRWFPLLDENGNLRPTNEQPLSPAERQESQRADRQKALLERPTE